MNALNDSQLSHTQADRASLEAEHAKVSKDLTRKINKINKLSKAAGLLADKIALKQEVKVLEEALRQHKLNFFDFVCAAPPAMPHFETGAPVFSKGVLTLFGSREAAYTAFAELLMKHESADWGDVSPEQADFNFACIKDEAAIESRYLLQITGASDSIVCLTTSVGHHTTRFHLAGEV